MSIEIAADLREPSDERLIGAVLANRYQIEVRLGEGAMGAVYKARHVKVGRPFAVKILHRRLLQDHKVAQRFEREAELAGRLRHPNVVGVVDVGETGDGLRYMVMDFAEGDDLATLLSEAPMPPQRIINLTRQMLEGLYHAHEAGLIHRDFKPENVIIELDDHGVEVPRIVDFGIAILRDGGDSTSSSGRITTNGLVLGTPHYMAPEQAVADPIDHRIDLFALGIVIYEMLCGKLPFDGSGAEVARANLLLDPPPIVQRVPYLEVDPLLEAFARRLMAKKRDHRPANAKAARELLDLIDRDPAAAAVALGVPGVNARQPAVTQDVVLPRRGQSPGIEDVHYLAHAQAQAQAGGQPGELLQHDLRTDNAPPLPYDGDATRRRRLLIIAGSALGASALLLALAIGLAGDPPQAAANEPVTAVERAPASEPAPPPPVVDQPAPAVPTRAASPDPVVPPADIESSDRSVPDPVVDRPPLRRSRPPATASTVRSRAATEPTPPAPRAAPPSPDRPAPIVKTEQPAADDVKPPASSEITAVSITRQYDLVNAKLRKLISQRNDAEANALADRIRLVKLNDLAPESLLRWAKLLADLDRDVTRELGRL